MQASLAGFNEPTRVTIAHPANVGNNPHCIISYAMEGTEWEISVLENTAAAKVRPLHRSSLLRLVKDHNEGNPLATLRVSHDWKAPPGDRPIPRCRPVLPLSCQFSAAAVIYEAIDLGRTRRLDRDLDNKFIDPSSAPLMPSALGFLSVHFEQKRLLQ